MLERFDKNPILVSGNNSWEVGAVFNCGVVFDGVFHMAYRAVGSGFSPNGRGGYDNYISSIGYARSNDGIHFKRYSKPIIRPEYEWEKFGCEDPRIVKFDDNYFIFYNALSYPAYSGKGCRIALATTKDFRKIVKHGVIGPDIKSKAGVIFPEKINDKIVMLFKDEVENNIKIAFLDDLFSRDYSDVHILLKPLDGWEGKEVEVGAPPLKTGKGWLLIYSGVSKEKVWSIGAVLLDLKDPRKIVSKRKLILKPEERYEIEGLVPNVTFPEGSVIVGDKIFVYYGGGDKCCCLATSNLNSLIDYLIK